MLLSINKGKWQKGKGNPQKVGIVKKKRKENKCLHLHKCLEYYCMTSIYFKSFLKCIAESIQSEEKKNESNGNDKGTGIQAKCNEGERCKKKVIPPVQRTNFNCTTYSKKL